MNFHSTPSAAMAEATSRPVDEVSSKSRRISALVPWDVVPLSLNTVAQSPRLDVNRRKAKRKLYMV